VTDRLGRVARHGVIRVDPESGSSVVMSYGDSASTPSEISRVEKTVTHKTLYPDPPVSSWTESGALTEGRSGSSTLFYAQYGRLDVREELTIPGTSDGRP
jgi:hypothetical protein